MWKFLRSDDSVLLNTWDRNTALLTNCFCRILHKFKLQLGWKQLLSSLTHTHTLTLTHTVSCMISGVWSSAGVIWQHNLIEPHSEFHSHFRDSSHTHTLIWTPPSLPRSTRRVWSSCVCSCSQHLFPWQRPQHPSAVRSPHLLLENMWSDGWEYSASQSSSEPSGVHFQLAVPQCNAMSSDMAPFSRHFRPQCWNTSIFSS